MWESFTAARDLGRVQEIASVLVRDGFGDLIRRMGMTGMPVRAGEVLPIGQLAELVALPAPVRVRRALEDMGPSFVKLGQVMATRVDLFAPEWIAELGKLQGHGLPVPFESIREQIVEDFGAAPEDVFLAFDPAVETPRRAGRGRERAIRWESHARLRDTVGAAVRPGDRREHGSAGAGLSVRGGLRGLSGSRA